jgi:hypothetical protein
LHGWLVEQLLVQVCELGSHAMPVGQSAYEEQPQLLPNRQMWPLDEPKQLLQLPLAPHAFAVPPAWQVVPSQQPVEQSWVAEQAVVHACITGSHECCAGQSAAELQPHAPPPVTATHAEPSALPAQLTHKPPCAPQAIGEVPAPQLPPPQQPPAHGDDAEQALPQLCVDEQALPLGQSATELQPQLDIKHRWPALLVEQSVQAPPAGPHAPAAVPLRHIPLVSQQLDAQAWLGEHAVVHWLVPGSQDEPAAQSALDAQPQWPPAPAAMHCVPTLLVAHGTQALPSRPQAPALVPATQLPL